MFKLMKAEREREIQGRNYLTGNDTAHAISGVSLCSRSSVGLLWIPLFCNVTIAYLLFG